MVDNAKIPIAEVIAQGVAGSQFFTFNIDFIKSQVAEDCEVFLMIVGKNEHGVWMPAISTSLDTAEVEIQLKAILRAMKKASARKAAQRN